jgi:hypothetical protein
MCFGGKKLIYDEYIYTFLVQKIVNAHIFYLWIWNYLHLNVWFWKYNNMKHNCWIKISLLVGVCFYLIWVWHYYILKCLKSLLIYLRIDWMKYFINSNDQNI